MSTVFAFYSKYKIKIPIFIQDNDQEVASI